jgi:predicted DNA-binding transcriptional regulator AlpA
MPHEHHPNGRPGLLTEPTPHPDPEAARGSRPETGRSASLTAGLQPLLLAAPQAAALCGVSEATWHRMNASGRCPAPLRLSRGCVRWRAEELRAWIQAGAPRRKGWEALRGGR